MISCNQMSADYLFQRDKHYDVSYDTGDKVIQCGRHNDIFKFWLMWRARVSEEDRILDNSHQSHEDKIIQGIPDNMTLLGMGKIVI